MPFIKQRGRGKSSMLRLRSHEYPVMGNNWNNQSVEQIGKQNF